jgi:hypothetical protein
MAKKTDKTNKPSTGEIILYQLPDGKAALDVRAWKVKACGSILIK